MAELTTSDLVEILKKKDYDAKIQDETSQVYVILKLAEREFPLFGRVMEGGNLVQLLAFFPCNTKAETVNDTGRLLHMLNKELDIPGFGMDEKAGVVFYRCMVPTIDDQLPDTILDGFLNSIKIVCSTFSPAVEAVALGAATFEELMKNAEEQAAKAQEETK